MKCSKVIYIGLIKNEVSDWNSEGYFRRACAIGENLGGKSQKNLIEHQII